MNDDAKMGTEKGKVSSLFHRHCQAQIQSQEQIFQNILIIIEIISQILIKNMNMSFNMLRFIDVNLFINCKDDI